MPLQGYGRKHTLLCFFDLIFHMSKYAPRRKMGIPLVIFSLLQIDVNSSQSSKNAEKEYF